MESPQGRLHDEQPQRDSSGDVSDADSDLEELQGDIAKFDESVRDFLASHRGPGESSQPARGGARGRGARGPRKAAKPRGDITARLSKVNQAFLSGDYDLALDMVFEIIRINAETHQAWTALSSIFRERGELSRALSAMVYAAHLRPKDVSGWMECASFAQDTIEDDEAGNLHTARLCYSAALRAEHGNVEARLGKAIVCHRQGHLAAAISEYNTLLKHQPHDLDIVRKLAEACVDNRHAESAIPSAIGAYRRYFRTEMGAARLRDSIPPWYDVGIYAELFASTGRCNEAIFELKALSRSIVGRESEHYWDEWHSDDREWDEENERRLLVPDFNAAASTPRLYGAALPYELRARLATYRLRLGHGAEALKHLAWLEPGEQHTVDFVEEFSFLAYDLASELLRANRTSLAAGYFETLQAVTSDRDPAVSLQLGRCYLAVGKHSAAEECFLAAIEADEDSIEARIELANMYEKAKEDEEALILAAEAIALREAREGSFDDKASGIALTMKPTADSSHRPLQPKNPSDGRMGARSKKASRDAGRPVIPRRYRPKRLGGLDRRRQDDQARALKLSLQYNIVRDLKRQIVSGRADLISEWMVSSKELVDDFRSLKRFYTWDKYLHFLGSKASLLHPTLEQPESELSRMYERLTRSVAPQASVDAREQHRQLLDTHQGISFDSWLDLFLDYAIGLAIANKRDESYQICEAARDSTVFQSPGHDFAIYVTWSVCAIYTNDEEKCVSTARHLMRDGSVSDSYRMFALLSRICQSPVSWYTSGPAQKYILRQIKAIDVGNEAILARTGDNGTRNYAASVKLADLDLDVCLLMLYGHILFTSTSYTYALGYFLRARSIDPNNGMVNLSLGLAYVHYGLKRQSTNRQYLLLQGQSFLALYAQPSETDDRSSLAEKYYNIGRLFQLLGISDLTQRYYTRAMAACKDTAENDDVAHIVVMNNVISLLSAGAFFRGGDDDDQ